MYLWVSLKGFSWDGTRADLRFLHLQGFLNLGVSENKLCIDLITERVSHVLGRAGTRPFEAQSSSMFLGLTWGMRRTQGKAVDR